MRKQPAQLDVENQATLRLWSWLFRRYGRRVSIDKSKVAGVSPRTASLRIFLTAFLFSCFLFWWLTSILYRVVLKLPDPVHDWALGISFLAVALFIVGYLLPVRRFRTQLVTQRTLDVTERFSYLAVMILTAPAILISLYTARSLSQVAYGSTSGVPFFAQAVFYPYLFFGLMYLGSVRADASRRRIALVCGLMIFPRALISLHYERFFVAQAIVPIVFLAVARGWIKLTKRNMSGFVALALILLFVPALTRGDNPFGQQATIKFFATGSSLKLFQDNVHLDLAGYCPPLLVSSTSLVIPYHVLGICTMNIEGLRDVPATLPRILTVNQIGNATDTGVGTGSNYMLELYLSGGVAALVIGSLFFGYCCKLMVWSLACRSVFTGIWAMCLVRALFAPRGDIGYVFQLVPGYVLATLFTVLLGCAIYSVGRRPAKVRIGLGS